MINVNSSNFDTEVLKSIKPVVIDFWASWCMPCQMMGPVFEQVSKLMPELSFVKINVDYDPELAAKYLISAIPAIVIIKDGEEIGRVTGFKDRESLKLEIKEALLKFESVN